MPRESSAATICAECKALLPAVAVYHPYAFCVLVKAGIDPEKAVSDAARYYGRHGWPEPKGTSRV